MVRTESISLQRVLLLRRIAAVLHAWLLMVERVEDRGGIKDHVGSRELVTHHSVDRALRSAETAWISLLARGSAQAWSSLQGITLSSQCERMPIPATDCCTTGDAATQTWNAIQTQVKRCAREVFAPPMTSAWWAQICAAQEGLCKQHVAHDMSQHRRILMTSIEYGGT